MRASGLGKIGFIGAGVVGTALAQAMHRLGYPVAAVSSRSIASAQRLAAQAPGCDAQDTPQEVADACHTVLLTVPDDAIEGVASAVSWRAGQAVLHCAGSRSLEVLAPAQVQGAQVGAFHPLQTFADPQRALAALPGTAFAVEAQSPLREELEELARALGGWPISLAPEDRVLYHISAVWACGFLVTLVKLAADLWDNFAGDEGGLSQEGLQALLPMVRATVEGLARGEPTRALTGPFVRGDMGTVQRHLETLAARAPEHLHLYCHLALAELPLVQAKGTLSQDRQKELERLLQQHLEASEALAG